MEILLGLVQDGVLQLDQAPDSTARPVEPAALVAAALEKSLRRLANSSLLTR
jgi:hypothetical protein